MANKDNVKGAEPSGSCLRARRYVAAATIYPGDLVKQEGGGRVTPVSATDAAIGVAMDFASGAGANVLVADHPDQEFVIQSSGTDPDAQTDIGLNYDITAGSADTLYKRSGMELDASSGGTLATRTLKLLRIDPRVDNVLGANADCVVVINNHQLKGGTGTDGV